MTMQKRRQVHQAEQAAIREMAALRAQGKALRAIAEAMRARGFKISHEGVKGVLAAHSATAERRADY